MASLSVSESDVRTDGTALEQQQYLTFMLAGEIHAIGILHIKEIIGYGQVTPVPMMPACIRGVINLRGRVVPVVDLAARFGRATTMVGKRTCIVILETDGEADTQDMGVVVDAVNEVLEIAPEDIVPPPAFGARIRTDFIQGMGRVDGGFVVILEVGQVLSIEELTVLQGIGDPHMASAPPDAVSGAVSA